MKRCKWRWYRYFLLAGIGVPGSLIALGQTADGNAGLNQANTLVRSYYDTATNLMYAIAGIMGLIGAVVAYSKIHQGHDAGKGILLWFGGCIFLALAATVIKSFFGL